MQTDRLANHSKRLAGATLAFIIAMLLINTAYWLLPVQVGTYIGGFNLSSLTETLKVDILQMPGWQVAGGITLSSIPLLILAKGLMALRGLFQAYGQGEYFSQESAQLLNTVGKSVALWVLATFILTPVMSVWITQLRPVGERMLSINFEPADVVALFLAASVMIVARSLQNACSLARENQQFV